MYPWTGKNIYFIGFMAAGKSTIGRAFADYLGWPFVDTDQLIEEQAGKPISEIFDQQGETAFRDLETRVLAMLAERKNCVAAPGGGAVLRDENWRLLETSGITVWLDVPEQTIEQRVAQTSHRPLLANLSDQQRRQNIHDMLQARRPFYERAQVKLKTGDQPLQSIVFNLFERLLYET